MDQDQPVNVAVSENESLNDALIECVKACGGSKALGHEIWPAKGVEGAQRHLLACLNPDRNEKLSPDEMLLVVRKARDRGCHAGMEYMAAFLSYSMPIPVEPKDELADLLRKYLQRRERDEFADKRLERLISQHLAPRVAA
jgi:hypothetical protein